MAETAPGRALKVEDSPAQEARPAVEVGMGAAGRVSATRAANWAREGLVALREGSSG